MSEENKPYLIISKECDEIQINIKRTKPYMKLQQENKQLKEENSKLKTRNSKQRVANKKLQEKYQQLDIKHDNLLIDWCKNNTKLDLYKSVINELREIITVNTCWDATTKKAFEILSKAEGSDK